MSFGPWQETKSSSGKIYYYNRLTEKSQWVKPIEWIEHDRLSSGDRPKLKPITPPPMPPPISSHPKREREHYHRHHEVHSPQPPPHSTISNQHTYSHFIYPSKSNTTNINDGNEETLSDDKKLEAISDDDDGSSGPPIKKIKCEDPLANIEMISEDSLSASKETTDERENYLPMHDDELDRYITDEFLSKIRIPEIEHIDAESRKMLAKQREAEKELFEVIKDQISVRQLMTTTQIMRKAVEIRSEFAKSQCESHGFDTQ
uniref:WW domain-containing protein n=1 Tax=Panagrolaimus superbus TaxID=310955 RepID=A0A914YWG3_9BILA